MYYIISGFSLVFFSFFGQTVFIGVFMDDIRSTYGLSYLGMSNIYTISFIAASLLTLKMGYLFDRIDAFKIAIFASVGMALGLFVATQDAHWLCLLIGIFILRLCGGNTMPPTAVILVNRHIDKNKGRATSYVQMGWPAMNFFAPLIAINAKAFYGWQEIWWLCALFALMILPALFFLLSKKTPTQIPQQDSQQSTSDTSLKDYRFYIMMSVMIMIPVFVSNLMFYQQVIASEFAIPHTDFIQLFAVFALCAVAGNLGSGVLIDKTCPRFILLAVPFLCCISLFMFVNAQNFNGLMLAISILGVADGASGTIAGPLLSKLYGTRFLGKLKTTVYTVAVLFAAIPPMISGAFLDMSLTMKDVFLCFAVYSAIALCVVCYFLPRFRTEAL